MGPMAYDGKVPKDKWAARGSSRRRRGQLAPVGRTAGAEQVPFSPGMHDPTKLEALQIATAATVRHSYQGEQLLYQPMADVGRDPMGFAVGTPGLPKHWGIRPV